MDERTTTGTELLADDDESSELSAESSETSSLERAAAEALAAGGQPLKLRSGFSVRFFFVAAALHIIAIGLLLKLGTFAVPLRMWLSGGTGSGKSDSPLPGNAGERGAPGNGDAALALSMMRKLFYADPTLPKSESEGPASVGKQIITDEDTLADASTAWLPDRPDSRLSEALFIDEDNAAWVGVRSANSAPSPQRRGAAHVGESGIPQTGRPSGSTDGKGAGGAPPSGDSTRGGSFTGNTSGGATAGQGTGTGAGDKSGAGGGGEAGMGGGAPGPRSGNRPPDYPPQAMRRRIQGTVMIRVQIAVDGSVRSPHIINSSGSDLLDDAALRAVRDWKYFPPTRDGVPQATQADLPVTFVLR